MKIKVSQASFLLFLGVLMLFSSSQALGQKISVETLSSSQVPVRITSSSVKMTKEGLNISYSLFSYDTQELSSVKLFAFRLNEKGKILGGSAWKEDNITVGALKRNKHLLAGRFSPDEKIVLVVLNAQRKSLQGIEEARVNLNDLVRSVKNYASKGILPQDAKMTESGYKFVAILEAEEGTCDVATIAVTVCGKNCVKSVDCKNETFTCKDTCPPAQD